MEIARLADIFSFLSHFFDFCYKNLSILSNLLPFIEEKNVNIFRINLFLFETIENRNKSNEFVFLGKKSMSDYSYID